MDQDEELYQVVLFCPVCCSSIHLSERDGTVIEEECTDCGQEFTVQLDMERMRQYSVEGK